MMMKICPKCRTKYKYGESCPNSCYTSTRKEDNKVYDKVQRKNKDFYHSHAWIRLTALCKDRFNGLDIYQLYKYDRVVAGALSHHIVEVEEEKARALDINNLIYLSDESHREIHKEYNCSEGHRKALQEYLFSIVQRHVEDR